MKYLKLFEDVWHKLDKFEMIISDFDFEKLENNLPYDQGGCVEKYIKKSNNVVLWIKRYPEGSNPRYIVWVSNEVKDIEHTETNDISTVDNFVKEWVSKYKLDNRIS